MIKSPIKMIHLFSNNMSSYISVFEISISSLHEMCCATAVFLNISSIVFIFWITSSQHVCLKLSDFIQFRMKFSSASILVIMVLLPAVKSPMRFSMLANRWSNANFKLDTSLLQASTAERIVELSTLARFRRGRTDMVNWTNGSWKVE